MVFCKYDEAKRTKPDCARCLEPPGSREAQEQDPQGFRQGERQGCSTPEAQGAAGLVSVYLRRDQVQAGMLVRSTGNPRAGLGDLYLLLPASESKCYDGFVLGQNVRTGNVVQINSNYLREATNENR